MHSGSPWSGRTANGVPDANDAITDVATGQRLFIIVPHRTSVSDQLVMITPLRGNVRVGTEVKEQAQLLLYGLTSIERTAYARFKRLITAHELHLFFAPMREEAAGSPNWAPPGAG